MCKKANSCIKSIINHIAFTYNIYRSLWTKELRWAVRNLFSPPFPLKWIQLMMPSTVRRMDMNGEISIMNAKLPFRIQWVVSEYTQLFLQLFNGRRCRCATHGTCQDSEPQACVESIQDWRSQLQRSHDKLSPGEEAFSNWPVYSNQVVSLAVVMIIKNMFKY